MTRQLPKITLQAAFWFVSLCLQATPAEIDITKVEKAKDKVIVEVEAGQAGFTVISSDGIGGFKATLKSGQWPRDMSIIINRKTLENFGLTTDRIWATGQVKFATNCWCAFQFRNREGRFDGDEYKAGTLHIKAKETKDGVELVFPRNLFSDTKQLTFSWIDFYRR